MYFHYILVFELAENCIEYLYNLFQYILYWNWFRPVFLLCFHGSFYFFHFREIPLLLVLSCQVLIRLRVCFSFNYDVEFFLGKWKLHNRFIPIFYHWCLNRTPEIESSCDLQNPTPIQNFISCKSEVYILFVNLGCALIDSVIWTTITGKLFNVSMPILYRW